MIIVLVVSRLCTVSTTTKEVRKQQVQCCGNVDGQAHTKREQQKIKKGKKRKNRKKKEKNDEEKG